MLEAVAGNTLRGAAGHRRSVRRDAADGAWDTGSKSIAVNANVISGNTVLQRSGNVSGTDGIRINTSSRIPCNDNVVELNIVIADQGVKTMRCNLNIFSPDCHRTVVRDNNFASELVGAVNDAAADTI